MKRAFQTAGWVVVLSLVVTGVAWAQAGNDGQGTAEALAIMLAPLLAAATAIERIIEMLFNWYESVILNASDLLGQGKGYLGWAQQQVHKWQNAVEWNRLSGDALRQAEDALEDAEERLLAYLKSPGYTSRKRVLTLAMGVLFGLIVAYATRLQMFSLLGIDVSWPWVDMFVTGLVIGTGSAPVHSLIGMLQNTKDAIDQARALWSGQAYSQALEAELKRIGLESEVERLQGLQEEMQILLETIKTRADATTRTRGAGEEPSVMAAGEAEAVALAAEITRAQERLQATRTAPGRSMSSTEADRRVRRILG